MNKSIIIGIVLLVIVVGATFLFNGNNLGTRPASDGTIREIKIDAKRFDFTPGTININKGEKIKLVINNMDTLHGIRIPDLGVSGNEVVEFTAPAEGTYIFYCNNFCGEGHSAMSGKIVVS